MEGASRSELAAELERTARLCEDTVELCVERARDGDGTDVVAALLLAAAAMDTASRAVGDDGGGDTSLMITSTLAGDAIGVIERRGLDEPFLRCVSALRRVSALCEAAVRR